MTNPLYRDMANTDFMTELKNRNSYETDRQNLDAKKKWNGLTVAVIDVNNLKLVNDRLGHAVGDDCIVNAARVLQSVESQKVTAYRYGGDEFILLLENYPEPEKLLVRVKKICKYGINRKCLLLWQQVMHSLTKIWIRRLQIHRDVQMSRCIRIR